MPVAVCAWASAAAAIRLPGPVSLVAAALGGMVVLLLLLVSRRSRRPLQFRQQAAAVLAPLAVLVLVVSSAGSAVAYRTAGAAGEAVASGASITGEFVATSDARAAAADRFSGKPRYLLEAQLRSFTLAGERSPARLPVLIIGSDAYAGIHLGDTFTTAGALSASEPGDRTAAVLHSSRAPAVEPADGLPAFATELRTGFAGRAQELGATDAAGLLPGMVLGDRSTAPPELTTAMQDTGLTHLTAVSGANCSYLLAFVFLLSRLVRLPRGAAAAVAVLVLAGFVLVVRPDASVLRAAVMGTIGTAAVLTGRGKVPAALLCLCATVLLVVDPWLSGSYAFILSVCATAGLIFLGPRLSAGLARFLPHPVAVLTAVPLAAQLACSPVLVLLQPNLPAYSLPANIAAAPVVPFVTIAGMAAVLLGYLAPPLDYPLLLTAGMGSGWVAGVARFFAQAPGALLPWLSGPAGAAAMAVAAAVLAGCIIRLGRPRPDPKLPGESAGMGRGAKARASARGRLMGPGRGLRGGGSRQGRAARVAVISLAAALTVMLGAVALRLLHPDPGPRDWIAAACDVGQGDALAVRTGPEAAILIDAGPDAPALDTCLDRLGIGTIELLVITHVHEDHYAGASAAADGREVKSLAFSSAEPGIPAEISGLAADLDVHPERLGRGGRGELGGVRWDVLWPPAWSGGASRADVPVPSVSPRGADASGPTELPGTVPGLTENDASAVLLIRAAGMNLLFTGDLEEDAALQMLRSSPELRTEAVHVLKVAHHGARNSGRALPEELRPLLALISVGKENTYGHPAAETLQNLESAGAQVARTDQLGSFILHVDAGKLVVSRLGRGP
ncbi:MAG: ComEC/Rec2 family competence protein [Arthrobacter sp.]